LTSVGAEELVTWLEEKELVLLNTPGLGTFFRPNLIKPSIIDLSFATKDLELQVEDWQLIPDLGSDH